MWRFPGPDKKALVDSVFQSRENATGKGPQVRSLCCWYYGYVTIDLTVQVEYVQWPHKEMYQLKTTWPNLFHYMMIKPLYHSVFIILCKKSEIEIKKNIKKDAYRTRNFCLTNFSKFQFKIRQKSQIKM